MSDFVTGRLISLIDFLNGGVINFAVVANVAVRGDETGTDVRLPLSLADPPAPAPADSLLADREAAKADADLGEAHVLPCLVVGGGVDSNTATAGRRIVGLILTAEGGSVKEATLFGL